MSRFIEMHRVALRDLDECGEISVRKGRVRPCAFLRATRSTMERLLAIPEMGSLYESGHPELSGMHFFPVIGFRNYLVFYRPTTAGIEVLRVLHGARDIEHLLGGEVLE